MIVKQEQEYSMTRRLQGNISYDVIFLIHACGSFHGTLKYHKIGTKLAYYIRIADYYYLWKTVVKMIDDCLKLLILRLWFCFLILRQVAVSGRVCCSSFWFHLCLTNRRPCLWQVPEKSICDPGSMIFYQILSYLISKVKEITVNIQKLLTSIAILILLVTFCLMTQVTQNLSLIRWTIPIPPCAPWLSNTATTLRTLVKQYRYHLAHPG